MALPRAFYLPMAMRRELVPGDRMLSDVPVGDRALWRARRPVARVYFAARTGTRVDVGRWFVRRRLCVLAEADGLSLVAAGPRPVFQWIAYSALNKSLYNHATGCVVLAPVEGAVAASLRMPLRGAEQLLAQIHRKGLDHA